MELVLVYYGGREMGLDAPPFGCFLYSSLYTVGQGTNVDVLLAVEHIYSNCMFILGEVTIG